MSQTGFQCLSAATLRFEVEATFVAARSASVRVRKFLKDSGVDEEELNNWELAIVEATNNVAEHGNTSDLDDRFQLDILADARVIEVRVTDFTPGFDYPDAVDLPDPLSEGGRGLFLIEAICDTVQYLKGSGVNCLVMRKARQGVHTEVVDSRSDLPDDEEKAQLRQQVAELDEALDGMTEELSSSYESLAAIFKFSQELSKQRDLDDFSHMILDHLLTITESDWYVLRIKHGKELPVFSVSNETSIAPLSLDADPDSCLELESAQARQDTWIEGAESFQGEEPLGIFSETKSGIVHPFYLNEDLVGTLSVGNTHEKKPFSAGQVNVLHTFSDFLALQILNARFQDEQIKSKVVSRELEIAANIQLSLLPKTLPEIEGFTLDGFYQSARHVGGDFYDAVKTPDGGLLLTIADVMGKGVPAAMFSAILRTVLRSQQELAAQPAALLQRANQLLFDDLDRVDMFITVQLVYVSPEGQFGLCASAGHCPLLVGNPVTGDYRSIEADGPPIGITRDLHFDDNKFDMSDGSRLILYTDGITEARNSAGELWGDDTLESWWREATAEHTNATGLKTSLIDTVKAFVGEAAATDDLTFLMLVDNHLKG
jgi:serine phosphatase RsbU (regulator of sigma subunit)/anti-sigma regulatory factor (Ser/Thr protein kinase)